MSSGIPEQESKLPSREKGAMREKINTKKIWTTNVNCEIISPMIKYYIKPNGTGTAYMVTCDTENEAQGELLSLQNKGLAIEAEIVSPTSFIFFASQARLLKAFVRQFICKHWLNAESLQLYKGKKGGFYADAQKYANEKFNAMSYVDGRTSRWILSQKSLPEIYVCGKISAEKDSGNWSDVLTTVLHSA